MKTILPKFLFKSILFVSLFVGQFAVGQTTATYAFSVLGGSNVTNPSGNIDANISFTSAKNAGTTAATYNSGGLDLRLYYSAANPYNGSSITLIANNGVTITGVEFESVSTTYVPTMRYIIGTETVTTSNPAIARIGASAVYTVSGLNITNNMTIRNANTTNEQMRMMYIKVTYTAPASVPVITGGTVSGTYGTAMTNYQIVATGTPTSYAVTTGTLPAGLSLNGTTGIISGTPTVYGNSSITVTATNANGTSSPATLNFEIAKKALTVTGLTADNKTYDGNTSAALSGTATLNGIIGNDDVTLTGTPTATFATSNVGNGIAVTVTGYSLTGTKANNYTLTQPSGLTANITALGAPIATASTAISSNGFTANWNAVSGATSYILNVYQQTAGGTVTKLTESFNKFIRGTTGSGAFSTDISGSLNAYTQTSGWSGQRIYEAGGTAKMGTGSGLGNITTPEIDLSGNSGNFTVAFEAMAWGGDNTNLDIYLNGVLVQTVSGLNNSNSYTLSPFTLNLTGGTATSTLTFEGKTNSGSRFFLENLVVTQGGVTQTNVAGSPFTINAPATTHTVTGLNPENTYYYTVQAVLGANTSAKSNVITVTTTATPVTSCIWNGTDWSNITGPTAELDAIIEGVYNTATNSTTDGFAAKSLTINSGTFTIASGDTVTITNGLNNTLTAAAVLVENNANLIQAGTTNQNTGNITVKRNSSALKRLDYTLWSSPTVGAQTLLDFSPLTMLNRFYTYNTSSNLYNVVTPSLTTFAEAKGYLVRMPDTHPATATSWEGSFIGKPNSGNISYTLVNDGALKRFNAVGNPYPSPINAFDFVQNTNNNASITGTLYFWRKTNNAASPSYSTWTTAGFVNNGEDQVFDPNGVIQTGQGFIVEGKGDGSVEFTNAMRVNNHANQFFRANNIVERSRIWLNATNADGLFSQTLVGYITDSNDGIDRADGKYMNDGPIALTSIINNTPYAIQGRSLPFDSNDIVPMQFKATTAGTYVIAIDHVDGLFTGDQNIYLRDAITGVDHNLKAGSYSFASEAGTFDNRFSVVYTTSTLSIDTPILDANAIVVYKNANEAFEIHSGATTMASVKIFDIRGRLLASLNNINGNQATITAGASNEVLLVQVTSVEGATVTKKVVR